MATKLPAKTEDKWSRLQKKWTQLDSVGGLAQFKLPLTEAGQSPKYPIRKLVHGQASRYTPQNSILLMGDTGSGKSLMVDAFLNFIYGVHVDDNFRVRIIHPEGTGDAQTSQSSVESQTKWITTYTIHPSQDTLLRYTLNIIDTPGFCDTSGIDEDERTVEHMKQLFKSPKKNYGVDSITCVCIVLKNDTNRTTASVKFMIDSTLQLFGKDLRNNIIVLSTHDSGGTSFMDVLKDQNVPFQKCFVVNNMWLHSTSKITRCHYDDFEERCTTLFQFILNLCSQSLNLSAEVLDLRTQLEESAQTCMEIMNNHAAEIVKLEDREKNLSAERSMEIESVETEKVDKISLTLNRLCPSCHVTCKTNVGRFHGWNNPFKRKKCEMCDCLLTKHIVEKKEYFIRQNINKYDYETFMRAQGKSSELPKIIADIKKEIKEKKQKLENALGKLRACSTRINDIALRPDPDCLSLDNYIDLLITDIKRTNTMAIAEKRISKLEKLKLDKQLERRLSKLEISADSLVQEYRQKQDHSGHQT